MSLFDTLGRKVIAWREYDATPAAATVLDVGFEGVTDYVSSNVEEWGGMDISNFGFVMVTYV